MHIRRSRGWLWLLVALQIVVPASYYLLRRDRDDERFAWRMFSAVRLQRCNVNAFDLHAGGARRPISLSAALHASWIRTLERGRQRVIERFLATRCQDPTTRSALLERRCRGPSGQPQPPAEFRYQCSERRLETAR